MRRESRGSVTLTTSRRLYEHDCEVTREPWQRNIVLRGLFELTLTFVDDDDLCFECQALAELFGGNCREMWFGADPGPGTLVDATEAPTEARPIGGSGTLVRRVTRSHGREIHTFWNVGRSPNI
jgi:hypothetical protein